MSKRMLLLCCALILQATFATLAFGQSLTGSISAVPQTVHFPPTPGKTVIHWTWNDNPHVWNFACVYTIIDGAITGGPQDCEHPGNNYAVTIPWLQLGHTYVFIIIPQQSPFYIQYYPPFAGIASTGVFPVTP
jgi:hypothetical protein